jgi:hypothetical protein
MTLLESEFVAKDQYLFLDSVNTVPPCEHFSFRHFVAS